MDKKTKIISASIGLSIAIIVRYVIEPKIRERQIKKEMHETVETCKCLIK